MHITITQLRPQVARALKPAINDPSVQLAVEKTFLAKASDERLDRLGKKVQDFALKRVGLAPAALTFFPQAAALIPPGQEVAFRKTLVDLEHVAASGVGEDWFKVGLFFLGTPKTLASLCDPETPTVEKLLTGGKLVAKLVEVMSPFVSPLAPYQGWAKSIGVCFEVGDICYLARMSIGDEKPAAKA